MKPLGDEDPLPPPSSVAEAVPLFHQHGWQNCGNHTHDLDNSKCTSRRDKNSTAAASDLACSSCHATATLGQLHDLPCGDLICRDCLVLRAFTVKHNLDVNRDEIDEKRAQMRAIQVDLSNTPSTNVREKRRLHRRHSHLWRSILHLAGLTCCGVNMRLTRFISCLGSPVSRALWLAVQWIADGPKARRACGWPDCRAYVPACCRYAVRDAYPFRWYCVTCEGNSMDCGAELRAAQTCFPFLSKGHAALTPAR
jgi:hypothetical protein